MLNLSRLLLCGSLLMLAGCSGAAESLGLGRNSPDEFSVVDRPPLSLPPEFSLRPPQPGAPRPQAISMNRKAEVTLFGGVADGDEESSQGEQALLAKAGADKADPNIRELIDNEASQKIVGNRHLVDKILWWKKDAPESTIVDAQAEAVRLRKAKEEGGSVTSGATPVIEKNKSGWLGL